MASCQSLLFCLKFVIIKVCRLRLGARQAVEKGLKRVDLPTLGSPTIPHFNDMSL